MPHVNRVPPKKERPENENNKITLKPAETATKFVRQ